MSKEIQIFDTDFDPNYRPSEVETMLRDDQREQKTTGRGVFGRASRRGYVGTMWFPVDLMDRKSKKEYTKAGEVKVTSTITPETILPYEDFLRLTVEKQMDALTMWRRRHGAVAICKFWGITRPNFYKLVHELHLPVQSHPGKKKEEDDMPRGVRRVQEPTPQQVLEPNKMMIALTGDYDGKVLAERLLKLSTFLDEGNKFKIELKIAEA